jgi:hypothetical protein
LTIMTNNRKCFFHIFQISPDFMFSLVSAIGIINGNFGQTVEVNC